MVPTHSTTTYLVPTLQCSPMRGRGVLDLSGRAGTGDVVGWLAPARTASSCIPLGRTFSQHETLFLVAFSSLVLFCPANGPCGVHARLSIGAPSATDPSCRPLVRTRVRQLNLDRHPEGGNNSNIYEDAHTPITYYCVWFAALQVGNGSPHHHVTLSRRPLKHA